jgi:hypothetical protein
LTGSAFFATDFAGAFFGAVAILFLLHVMEKILFRLKPDRRIAR